MRQILILAAIFLTTVVNAQSKWVNIGNTDESEWDIQAGSFEESKTKGGVPIAVVVGRVTQKKTKQINVLKWYVSVADCNNKMGKLVALNIDGTYRYENDVVFGAGSIGSSVAEMICAAYEQHVEDRRKKGV